MNLSIFTVFLKNKNIIFKIRRSKVTEYAALNLSKQFNQNTCYIQSIEVFYFKYVLYKQRGGGGEKSYKETRACTLVFIVILPPSVYKPH